ncbi:MAG: hypothetical protein KY397_06610 [Gemmatimonadetes bacterium]|nr:hypothetical protein [Gemmatimonadota bacterium]
MKSIPLLLALVLAPAAAPAAAQVPFDRERDQGVGVMAGVASATGVSYREFLPTAWGYRATLALWKLSDFSFVSIGGSGMRVLSDDGWRKVYLVGSASYWRRGDEEDEEIFDDEGNLVATREVDDVDDSVGVGVGAGIELPLGDRGAVSLEGVFTYWTDSGALLPLPQIGLHYLF